VRTNTHTFYLRYTGPLPGNNDVKVDVTINEVLSFPLANRPVYRGYAEFTDLPENRPLLVYSLDEIAAEKTVALTDPARNEPRDLYDLWYLTVNEEVHLDQLLSAICQKLEFREKPTKACSPRSSEKKPVCELSGPPVCPIRWWPCHPLNRFFVKCVASSARRTCPKVRSSEPSIFGPLHVLRSVPAQSREQSCLRAHSPCSKNR
jgi:hypothetical protein